MPLRLNKVSKEARYLPLTIFLMLQMADGVLTYAAVSVFGREAEGNPLMRLMMFSIGNGAAILTFKFFAALCGLAIHLIGVFQVLTGLNVFLVFVVLIPWIWKFAWTF